jgi:hypothetical protein
MHIPQQRATGGCPQLTAAEVTEDLLNSRSASLNFRFLRSFLLLEFLKHTEEINYKHQAMSMAQAGNAGADERNSLLFNRAPCRN